MIAISSAITGSAIVGAWSLINQIQMLILILLMNASIPQTIVKFLTGMEFAMFSFDFMIDSESGVTNKIRKWFGGDQEDKDLKDMGLDFDSIISNNLSLIFIFVLLLTINLVFFPIRKWLTKKYVSYPRMLKLIAMIKKLLSQTIFLRLFLEANQFLLLCSMSEVGSWNFTSAPKILSFIVSFATSAFCSGALLFFIRILCKTKGNHTWLNNGFLTLVFEGLKYKFSARFYPILLLIRRYLLIVILTQLKCYEADLDATYLIPIICLILMPYLYFLVKAMPFEKFRDNCIEVSNEIYFFIFVGLLAYFNTPSRWETKIGSETITNVYMYLIAINSMTSFTIAFLDFVVIIVKI